MTPDEIKAEHGDDALERLYDYMFESDVGFLVEWILELLTPEAVRILINDLTKEDE